MRQEYNKDIYIYPTDTIWGIGAPFNNRELHERIYSIKGRDDNKPLSLLFTSRDLLFEFVTLENRLLEGLLPLFDMEVTFLLPKESVKHEIGEFIVKGSSYIGIRFIDSSYLNRCFENQVVTTTSLNISGESSITDEEDARRFYQKHCPSCTFIEKRKGDFSLSGQASTIIMIETSEGSLQWKIIREGRNAVQIKNDLQLLTTSFL